VSLSSGTRLGSYEITAQIGVGGMGEVYRATDTNLKRQVAIKVLPASVAGDAERLARFQREAEVLAALNHPHIAAIYGLEKTPEFTALVMELVEGDDLSQRIARGAIPIDEALPIARQIAEALEAAHEQGIIHRDLKPANIKVRADGTVKVLDFGLAKAMEPAAGSSPSVSMSPTITTPAMTQAGMILGTAAYMSPEQARGKAVDKRADIWAFGAVLFEMLTGTRAFPGEDITDTLAAVVRAEPEWTLLPAGLSPALVTYLKRCLHKDPKQRIPDIAAMRLALEGAFETAAPQTPGTAVQPAPASTRMLPWAVAAALVIVAAVTAFGWWRATRPVEQALRPLVRLDVDLGADVSLGSPVGTDAILSPDGTRLVYLSQRRLWTRRLDQPTATELPGTQGAFAPFFSPDGQWVAFFATGGLQKISVEGGAAIVLSPAGIPRGGSWGEDGTIIAALNITGGLSQIPAAGGPPTPLTDLQAGDITHRWPQILPGGQAVLFTSGPSAGLYDTATIDVVSLADHHRTTLVRGGTFGRYLPSGHLVYVQGGTLFAVPFDLDRLEVHGTPAPVLDQVDYSTLDGSAQLAFSQTGTLLYRSSGAGAGLFTVAWLDAAGQVQPLLAKPGAYGRPSLSPDGQRLALEVTEAGTDVWVYDWPRDTMTRVTFTGTAEGPVWSPDGRYLAFRTVGGGMAVTRADGGGPPQPVTQSQNQQYPWSFTPDGTRLAFMELRAEAAFDLWTVPLEREGTGLRGGTPEPFLQTQADERAPAISPDGRWMAYASAESGTFQVYVRAFPDTGGKWQISNSGGTYPMWSRTGHELFFETLENQVVVASYAATGESFAADRPHEWSAQQLGGSANTLRNIDLASDGKRIIALMPVETGDAQRVQSHVTFLLNFFDDVRRKVPVGQ
jgi:Tol biopolymer transport system component